MRVRISHQIRYEYAPPARGAIHLLRLTPRDHEGQHVRFWRIDVLPEARLRETEDCLGNVTHMLGVDGPLEVLTISVEGEVDVWNAAGMTRSAAEPFPPHLFLRDTGLTLASMDIRAFAARAATEAGGDRLSLLHDLMLGLHQSLRCDAEGLDATATAAEAFARGHGDARDFAHMFVAAARSAEIPARYVSGYLAREDGLTSRDGVHAWAEAHVDRLGWVGFDCTRGVSPTECYVRVAVGIDSLGAAPVLGARHGAGEEKLGVRIVVDAAPLQAQN